MVYHRHLSLKPLLIVSIPSSLYKKVNAFALPVFLKEIESFQKNDYIFIYECLSSS